MDQVDITAVNTGNFAWAQDITDWAALYPLSAGLFRAQMRLTPESSVAYEWSSTNGRVLYGESPASGSFTFASNPIAGTHVQVGSTVVTFVASAATGLQVNVEASLAATLASLLTLLSGSTDPQLSLCSYALSGNAVLSVVSKATGIAGNGVSLWTDVAGALASGTTLVGGSHLVTLTAPISETEDFVGAYSYDVRYQFSGLLYVPIFGGTITWTQGVTRDATDSQVTLDNVPTATTLALAPNLLNSLIFG